MRVRVVGICARKPEEVGATQDALHDRGRVAGTAVDVADGDALAAWSSRRDQDGGRLRATETTSQERPGLAPRRSGGPRGTPQPFGR